VTVNRETQLALQHGTTELESALITLSAYMEDEDLTPAQRRTITSATAKMSDATLQMSKMLRAAPRAKIPGEGKTRCAP
jgi:hypothetical protein